MIYRIFITLALTSIFAVSLSSCTGIPEGIEPVKNFDMQRYLGKWHEVARLDHAFERGLSQVSAEYSLRDDGGIRVVNRGYNTESNKWSDAEGKAYFIDNKDVGHLKVSFFGPFYASYIVFKLGTDYEYAFVSGNSKDYLWLLARKPEVDTAVSKAFLEEAQLRGFAVDDIIWVEQKSARR